MPPSVLKVFYRHPGLTRRCFVSQQSKMAQSGVCTAVLLLSQEGNRTILDKKGTTMPQLSDPVWLADLVFLVDITRHLTAEQKPSRAKCSGKPTVFTHQSLSDQATTFPTASVTGVAYYRTFLIAAGNYDQFPAKQYNAPMTKYASDVSCLVKEFQQRFRDFAAIGKEITLFPLLSSWTQITLQSTCS